MEAATAAMIFTGINTVVGFASSMSQAKYQRQQAALEAQQREENAELARIEALQQEAERERTLRRTKAQQIAQAAALGFDPLQSRSFFAIQRDTERTASRDIDNIRLNGLVTQSRELLSADSARLSGKAAGAAGAFKAFGSILGGGAEISKIMMET